MLAMLKGGVEKGEEGSRKIKVAVEARTNQSHGASCSGERWEMEPRQKRERWGWFTFP